MYFPGPWWWLEACRAWAHADGRVTDDYYDWTSSSLWYLHSRGSFSDRNQAYNYTTHANDWHAAVVSGSTSPMPLLMVVYAMSMIFQRNVDMPFTKACPAQMIFINTSIEHACNAAQCSWQVAPRVLHYSASFSPDSRLMAWLRREIFVDFFTEL